MLAQKFILLHKKDYFWGTKGEKRTNKPETVIRIEGLPKTDLK